MGNADSQEYFSQGKVLMGQEKYQQAIPYFDKAIEGDRMNIDIYLAKGVAHANMDHLDDAKECFEKALKINRKDGLACFHLGNVLILQGEKNKGIEQYNQAIAYGYDDAQIYFTLALMYEEDGNDELALRNYNKALDKDPMRPDARVRKINILIRHNQPQEAMQAVDEMILACPDVFEGYHLRFLLLQAAGRLEEAADTLQGAMKLFPKDVGFSMDMASLLLSRKEHDKAMNCLDEIEKNMEIDIIEQHDIAMQRAKICADRSDMEGTIRYLEQVKKIALSQEHPTLDREAVYLLMNCYLGSSDYEKVIENAQLLKKEEEADAFVTAAYYFEPFALHNQKKDDLAMPMYKEAVSFLRNVSLKDPSNIDSYVFRIMCLRDLKQLDKAMELADYLVAVQDGLAEAHTVRAVLLEDMGKHDEAVEEQKKAEAIGGVMMDVLSSIQKQEG